VGHARLLLDSPDDRPFLTISEPELVEQADGLFIRYPNALPADTLRRIIFYTVAIVSNRDSGLVFEEPESKVFLYYTKYLGERITLDETNQFFIATRNPYLRSAIIEKGLIGRARTCGIDRKWCLLPSTQSS
jgi:hypothetical protein